jgi:hypothetical protein
MASALRWGLSLPAGSDAIAFRPTSGTSLNCQEASQNREEISTIAGNMHMIVYQVITAIGRCAMQASLSSRTST